MSHDRVTIQTRPRKVTNQHRVNTQTRPREGDQPTQGEHSILDVLHKHDSSFELDELDQKMMKLDMNRTNSDSPGAVSLSMKYEDLYESTENSSTVVYIDSVHGDNQLIASESSDVPASDTEATYDSDLMSVLDNSNSETSDNESNQSSKVVPPSVFEYDGDNMIQLDEDGNSSIISYQMVRSHAVEPVKDSVESLSDGEVSPLENVNSVPHAVQPAKDSVESLSDGEVSLLENVNLVPHAVEPVKDSVESLSDGEVSPLENVNSVPHAVEPANEIDKSSNPANFPLIAEMNVNQQTCEEETEQVSSSVDDFSREELEMKLILMSLPDVIREPKPTYMDGQRVMNPYQKQDEEAYDTEPYADSDSVPDEVT